MDSVYNESYYTSYDVGVGKVNYADAADIRQFLEAVADRIVSDLHPKTVLDAGCAMGYLVAALRDRGVEAYGVDISEYAVSRVREDIRPYCAVGSLTEPLPEALPRRYDLVVTIEVLEHLYAEDGKKAIANLCSYGDCVLFSSTPDDYEEATHVNVQQREYWARLFAENGFYDDIDYRPTYVTHYAALYKKSNDFYCQIESYERHIRRQDAELTAASQALAQQQSRIDAPQQQLAQPFFRKIAHSLRKAVNRLRNRLRKCRPAVLCGKGLKCLRQYGVRYTWLRVKKVLIRQNEYAKLKKRPLFTEQELAEQRIHTFPRDVRFSIVVPLYNTPESFLREMLQSVIDQTYANWELCLADGSDAQHSAVRQICEEYAEKDRRIRYRKLEKNLGISGNTNACIDMATGEYIGLFDHDDLLHPAVLYEVMKAICEKGADFIYTDEAIFESPNINRIITAHFKPDYAPDNLRANNYICHFTVFQAALLQKTGVFRSAYDGSQDHDLTLRLTDAANCIVHIPKILYYWRSHPQSVAQSIGSKPYAALAGRAAVRDSLAAKGIRAEVDSTEAYPAMYRVKYRITDCPQIDIIILARDRADIVKRCVDSVFKRSTYPNYHIIIVGNSSAQQELLDYLATLSNDERVTVLHYEKEFQCSAVNNWAAEYAEGKYYLFLNDTTEVITNNWMEELLMYAQRSDVAAVGAMLYYPNNTIYHAGIILGMGQYGTAGYAFHSYRRGEIGYMGRLCYAQNMSAVAADCMLVKAEVFHQICGFDEAFSAVCNDVDLCMRIRAAGYLIVWTPYAELYHYESKSRGAEDTPKKRKRFEGEVLRFQTRWAKELAAGDPYYNPNFTLRREDFSLKDLDE